MLKVYDLRTEYLKNPMGIDAKNPRFSWKLESDHKNVRQRNYRILAFSDSTGQSMLWDSQVAESEESVHVQWEGPSLYSRERVYWKVLVEAADGNGCNEKVESEMACFEMGLMDAADWKAQWIEAEEEVDLDGRMPCPYLRKAFQVKNALKSARIYQSAHGLYEFWINGKRGTEDVFKPGFTSYYHRIQYQVYDITGLLQEGDNCWAVALGDGWWRGTTGGSYRNNFGYKLSYIGQIILEYEDGTIEYILTDETFRTSNGGLVSSDMKEGDVFNAALDPRGWRISGFDDSKWKQVHLETDGFEDKASLISSRSVPVRERECFQPEIIHTPNGEIVLDFGQNIAGYVRMRLHGLSKGQKIICIHGEALDEEGNFTLKNMVISKPDARIQQVEYIAAGKETEEYCPIFSVFGFQYMLLKGYEGEIRPGDFTAVVVYSALEESGDFTCSYPLINQLVRNSRWSQKGNFLDVPTDCPTRERSPWSGDSQIYLRTASDFMNVYPFFEKWLQDLSVEQFASGKVPNTIPMTAAIHNPAELKR